MKLKNFFALSLAFIFMFVGAINVNATDYSYGYWKDIDSGDYWNLENQDQIKSSGTWHDDVLVLKTGGESIIAEDFFENLVDSFPGSSYEYLGNGKYAINLEGNISDASMERFDATSDLWEKIKMFAISRVDMTTQMNYEMDFSNLNKYYEKYQKMPEVIVLCETTESNIGWANIGENWSNIDSWDAFVEAWSEIVQADYKSVFYYDSFDQPETFNFNMFFNEGADIAESTRCYYYATNRDADLNVCYSFNDELQRLETVFNNFGKDSNEYQTARQELKDKCDNYIAKVGTSIESNGEVIKLACYEACKYIDNRLAEIEGVYQDDYRCGAIGTKLAMWLMRILKIIRYIVPVLIIILSTLDFIGAVGSSNDDAMKKASQKLTKRIIAAVVLFLLPVVLQFLFDVFKVAGLESGNPFCMK